MDRKLDGLTSAPPEAEHAWRSKPSSCEDSPQQACPFRAELLQDEQLNSHITDDWQMEVLQGVPTSGENNVPLSGGKTHILRRHAVHPRKYTHKSYFDGKG
jgi:hypothetical protein